MTQDGVLIWCSKYMSADLPFSSIYTIILETLEASTIPANRQPTLTYFFSMDPKTKYALTGEGDWVELRKRYRMEVAKKKEQAVVKIEPPPKVSSY